jgi:hypothetical protein
MHEYINIFLSCYKISWIVMTQLIEAKAYRRDVFVLSVSFFISFSAFSGMQVFKLNLELFHKT